MKRGYKASSSALALIIGMQGAVAAYAAEMADEKSTAIQEIIVTSQRRSESAQDVPIAVQAFGDEALKNLNVATFDDLAKYAPNVSASSNGPGMGNIYMRGLSTGAPGATQTGSVASFPNVAVYLDEQSGALPGRNLDVYAADLERVEILEGPQGTLFGGGAQAGAVRYITNKPKLDKYEGYVEAGYGTTAGGANNQSATAVVNIPVIKDALAVRAVVYGDRRGGYINNVPGTFTRSPTDIGISYANYATGCSAGVPTGGLCPTGSKVTAYGVPPSATTVNNSTNTGNNINPVTYQGARLSVAAKINDDWDVLVTQTVQDMDAEGVFYQEPVSPDGVKLAPRSVVLFTPAYDHDNFNNTAWTVNGKVGDISLVYAGSYLNRHVEQEGDYTNYSRGAYVDYYQCYGAGKGRPGATCYSPVSPWFEVERNTHISQEVRASTPSDWRVRGIVGGFWEQLTIHDETDWFYKSIPNCTSVGQTGCMSDAAPAPGSNPNNPATRADKDAFFDDITRGYKQLAEFASVDVDIIPQVLTVTGGARHFSYDENETGTKVSSFGCFEAGPSPCTAGATNITAEGLQKTFGGTRYRANATWHIEPDIMVYYTWSQGFRPGGFNRTSSCHVPGSDGKDQYCLPSFYTSDDLTNNEIGWKTLWLGHHLQFDGAIYQENWDNTQVQFFDPGQLGNLNFVTNGQNYVNRGIESSVVARPFRGLTIQGSAAWNTSRQTNSPYLIDNFPGSVNFGKPITAIANPYGPIGSPAANAPAFQSNIHVRYEDTFGDYDWFVQGGMASTNHYYSESGGVPAQNGQITTSLVRYVIPGFQTFDASAGIARGNYQISLVGQNLTNKNASVFTNANQFIEAQTVIRPRVLGVKLRAEF